MVYASCLCFLCFHASQSCFAPELASIRHGKIAFLLIFMQFWVLVSCLRSIRDDIVWNHFDSFQSQIILYTTSNILHMVEKLVLTLIDLNRAMEFHRGSTFMDQGDWKLWEHD